MPPFELAGHVVDAIKGDSSPTGVVPEWTRPVPGEVPAGSGLGRIRLAAAA